MKTHSSLDLLRSVGREDVSFVLSADTDISSVPGVTIAANKDRTSNPEGNKDSNGRIKTLQGEKHV